MKNKSDKLVSIIVVTYNSAKYIQKCLESITSASYQPLELIIVDNNSTDQTVELVESTLKKSNKSLSYQLVKNSKNLGYAKGNNIGAQRAKGRYLFILNPDTYLEKNVFEPLVNAFKDQKKVAAAQPAIYLFSDPKRLNSAGKVTHFLGFDWVKDYRSRKIPKMEKIDSFSGSGVMIDRQIFTKLGGYDSEYFMYFEDTDLSWRMRLAGYQIWLIPAAKIFHDYKYIPDQQYQPLNKKLYLHERNRLLTIFKNYSLLTLVVLSPMILMVEISMIFYSLFHGWVGRKLHSYLSVLSKFDHLRTARTRTQRLRQISDRQVTQHYQSKLTFKMFQHPVVRYLLNPVMTIYWWFAKRLI